MSQKYNKTEVFIKKISYQAEQLDDGLAFFDFYDPSQQKNIVHELKKNENVHCQFYGGQILCERKMLCLHTTLPKKDISWPILVCTAQIDFDVDHRMVLGSIMQLGVSREIIGDIIIQDTQVQIVVKEHIAQYISMNILKLNNRKVLFEVHDISSLTINKQSFKMEDITVSSFRLDAIISAAYGLSRETASELIKKHGVKINHEEKLKPTASAQIGDLFSVKGKGRFILEEFTGTTRKEKNKVRIKKYM